MADAISVAVRRGDIVESVHRVHCVALRDGELLAAAGDSRLPASLRSSAKPFQALPVSLLEFLDESEVAIACASHQAEPAQLEAVKRLLEHAEATEHDLVCGSQEGRPPGPLHHNCSGKHAGMLAVCLVEDLPREGYYLPEHPLQARILAAVADLAGVEPTAVAIAIDGCGVPCFALSLEQVGRAYSNLEHAPGGERVARAMRDHPRLVGGDGALDTELMEELPGWIAKRGAEGLFTAASADGLGVALKVEDGAHRALRPALGAFLDQLGLDGSAFGPVPVSNSRDEVVGELKAC